MITRTELDKELNHLNERLSIRRMPTYQLEVWQARVKGSRRFVLKNTESGRCVSAYGTAREMFNVMLGIGSTLDYILP